MIKNKTKIIIAVIGMAGSGKSEAINYLQKKFDWPKIYFGSITFDRIKKESLELNYKNERIIREKIRSELGMGAYAKLALPKIKNTFKKSNVILIESLYSWDEYKIIKKEYSGLFKTIAIYASPEIRFLRLKERKKERPIKNFIEFKTRDYTEIENVDKGGPIAMADYTIINQSGLNELHKNIDIVINSLIK